MGSEPAFAESEEELPPPPLSAEQARRLRERHPMVSPWRIVWAQLAAGLLAAVAAWAVSRDDAVGWSVVYGALAVAGPAAVFARALSRRMARGKTGPGFLAWELVKVGLTVLLLVLAPRLVPGLNWLALVAGVVLATKMYWVAIALPRRPCRNEN